MNSSNDRDARPTDLLFSSVPLQPTPVSVEPALVPLTQPKSFDLSEIQVILLDVYGTLVISGSGDVGTADDAKHDAANRWIREAATEAGVEDLDGIPTSDQLRNQIVATNEAARSETNPKPEVDILEIWRRVLQSNGRADLATNSKILVAWICGVEGRSNPVWPMPGAHEALMAMQEKGRRLGIVSNAQFYTPLIVRALMTSHPQDAKRDTSSDSAERMIAGDLSSVFDLNACHFSYRYRAAKPGPLLFDRAMRHLSSLGISPDQVLYVGNDMLNDVWAAKQFGLRTALFAGDGRSLRLRTEDARCQNCFPDMVLTRWEQIVECL
ncbi:HAD family hydrolase [Rhodopirellula bahusiensis]|uniref:HAD family hydrolase n=1 Tax=Rhodopirellula bahusiensis TaxID=2014065 RepID=A0A2G1VZ07_9BACT|nr:HAD family hydrolase [Rhodopirellula bahusiensis]PHQ32028.1 HAD family hydrolase [Rhodopirellula bahusiensis]